MSVENKWTRAALKLGTAIPRERLQTDVVRWADASRSRRPWAVALSGGADSVALLLLLWAHWPRERARLIALHFDHRLRAAASTADAAFCRRVSKALGIRFRGGRWAEARNDATEAEARAARFAFFRREMSAFGATALWLGQQKDDVVETMLMRLARGSGTGGLAAPRPVQTIGAHRVHLRPLLSLEKREIEAALRSNGIGWRQDATNESGKYLRNRMRLDVVPRWRAANGDRDALAGAALSRELLEEDDAALNAWVAELAPLDARGALRLSRIRGKPRAVVRRAVHLWLGRNFPQSALSRAAFGVLMQDVELERETRRSLGPGMFAEIRRGKLQLIRDSAKKRKGFQRRSN
ncbi:MAG TPA: tRNA lysidine(34) synthetase TilS [Opitutus sp.]|nr:tRNA lysidine(34) synthetase TilS [Opitutus sp.]